MVNGGRQPDSGMLRRAAWALPALVIVMIAGGYVLTHLREDREEPLPVLSKVTDFTLTNQFGHPIALSTLKGRIWLANVIFTRCAGPCPKMTRQMKLIDTQLGSDSGVQFVSLTADPAFDTPEVLRKYVKRFGISDDNWHFLTGEKSDVYDLAIDGLKVGVNENEEPVNTEDLFIHSTYFILVDPAGRVRAYFEGIEQHTPAEVVRAIRQLQRESE